MAEVLSQKVMRSDTLSPFVGVQLLDTITAGMYDNPLMIYREYVQNSVDAVDDAVEKGIIDHGEGDIGIHIDGRTRKITITDNGTGVFNDEVRAVLGDLGNSDKNDERRGFRGIGRLGGLGYCEKLKFETRASASEPVSVVKWDGKRIRELLKNGSGSVSLREAVQDVCTVGYHSGQNYPSHFFRVTLSSVRPFHEDLLMDVKAVRSYLSQVAPVPYSTDFTFGQELREKFSNISGYKEYRVTVNGSQIFRPYRDTIELSGNSCDRVKDVEIFEFDDKQRNPLACGWYANTDLTGVLPQNSDVRGIRVRSGNIEVGGENFLADYVTEERFCRWHLGEIHVCNTNIRPNARRDDFEQTEEYEKFLEYCYLLGKHLSKLCRKASKRRSIHRQIDKALKTAENLLENPSVVLTEKEYDEISERCDELISKATSLSQDNGKESVFGKRLKRVKKIAKENPPAVMLSEALKKESFQGVSPRELLMSACARITEGYHKSRSPSQLVATVVNPYLQEKHKGELEFETSEE